MNKKNIFISPLALSFWLPLLVMLSYFIYRGMAPFGTSSVLTVDLGQQYIDQFAAFKHTLISHPSSFFYSFSNALGGDMISEWAYYLMSPFNLIYLFVPLMQLPAAILIVTVLKFGTAGLSMAYLLKSLKLQKNYYVSLFAINYALSGWFIANDLNLLWLDAAILLPLLILQLEQLFNRPTYWRYALILGLTIISNYYIAYMIVIFITIYFIWRITWPNQIQPRWQTLKHFVVGSFIGGALSAWLILPTYYQLKLGKAQYSSDWSLKFDNNPLKLLFKLVPGSFDFNQMQTGQANFYVSAFILIVLLTFFTTKTLHWTVKLGGATILVLLFLATTWAPLTLIFHGFQYPVWYPYRFSFIISFFMIYLAALSWQPNWRPNLSTIIIIFLILVAFTAYALTMTHKIAYISQQSVAIFVSLFLLTLAMLLFKQQQRLWLPILIFITTISLASNVILSLNRFSYLTNTEYQNSIKSLNIADETLKKDKSWYRVAQTFQRTRGDAMMLDYYSGSHFSSALPKTTPNFFGNFGQPDGDNYVVYSNGSILSDALLGMKYVLTPNNHDHGRAGEPSTHLIGYRPDTIKYALQSNKGTSNVLNNPYALPIAFSANSKALKTPMLYNNPLQNQGNLWQDLSGDATSPIHVENFQQDIGHNVNAPTGITGAILTKVNKAQPAQLNLQFTPATNDSYYLTLGSGLPIKEFDLLINNKVITQFSSYRHTVLVNLVTKAKNKPQTVTIRFKNTQSLVLNNFTLYRVDNNQFQRNNQQLKQHPIKITKRNERLIAGEITTTKQQQLIMTTIPDAPGWHITLDGKSASPSKVANYFIAVHTTPGKHTIQFKYTPPLFWLGLFISLLAVLALILSLILKKTLARKRST
ncbi:MAG: YfhO family protein [Leuconostoc sp.]|nr:YfhO family protein [Leuconostoc sp.]